MPWHDSQGFFCLSCTLCQAGGEVQCHMTPWTRPVFTGCTLLFLPYLIFSGVLLVKIAGTMARFLSADCGNIFYSLNSCCICKALKCPFRKLHCNWNHCLLCYWKNTLAFRGGRSGLVNWCGAACSATWLDSVGWLWKCSRRLFI